jgi:hypothetical protein
LTATETIGGTKTFNNLVNITNQMTISGSVSGANILLGKNTSNNGVGDITLGTGLSLASNILTATQIDTTSLSNRINGKVGLTGNETISGDKTFSSRVNTPWLERTYTSSTATSLTVSVNTTWLNIHQDANVTLTLPNAATYPGKELIIKQTGAGTVFSASSNVIEFATSYLGSPQNVIINPSLYRFTTLVSDGTYWIKMQRN